MPRLSHLNVGDSALHALQSLVVPFTTAEGLLDRDPQQLARELGLSCQVVQAFRYEVALKCQPARSALPKYQDEHQEHGHAGEALQRPGRGLASFESAAALHRQALDLGGFLHTGSERLDELLHEGIGIGHVTEIVGQSSTGKTQLCLTAAVLAAMNGVGVLYIDTATSFNAKRAGQIAHGRCRQVLRDGDERHVLEEANAVLDRIMVRQATDVMTVMAALQEYQQMLLLGPAAPNRHTNCRLVIVDSATAVLTPLLGGEKNLAGHGLLTSMGHLLSQLAAQCSTAVLVTNNMVSDRAQDGSEQTGLKAALGVAWTYMATNRLVVQECSGSNTRTAVLVKHPGQPCGGRAPFSISHLGVIDAPSDMAAAH